MAQRVTSLKNKFIKCQKKKKEKKKKKNVSIRSNDYTKYNLNPITCCKNHILKI